MEDKEYEEMGKQEEETLAHNNEVLKEFEIWISAKSLKPKTINTHVQNIEFFC